MSDEQADIQLTRPARYAVHLYVSAAEWDLLTAAARFHGRDLGAYIREAALESACLPQVRESAPA